MIDLSHDNSGKDPERQPAGGRGRGGSRSPPATRTIVGVMIESFLRRRAPGPRRRDAALVYGQSITDGCIGWETTVEVLDGLADAVRTRRRAA